MRSRVTEIPDEKEYIDEKRKARGEISRKNTGQQFFVCLEASGN